MNFGFAFFLPILALSLTVIAWPRKRKDFTIDRRRCERPGSQTEFMRRIAARRLP